MLELETLCYSPATAYGAAEYRYALVRANAVNLVAEEKGKTLGFAGCFLHEGWRAGHVYTVNVHPDARGRGLGAELLASLERRMKAAGMRRSALEVSVGNAAAIRLYEKAGYAIVERLHDYYEHWPERDAWRMSKSL